MGIPSSQMTTWTNRGAISSSSTTYNSIKNALNTKGEFPVGASYEVYLQGSYANATNIRGDSDVDVVVELETTHLPNTSALKNFELERYKQTRTDATYLWQDFRQDVLVALTSYYGTSHVSQGKKTLKVEGSNGTLDADVVVCIKYRKYLGYPVYVDTDEITGIAFWVSEESRWVINYPKLHLDNGQEKNSKWRTDERYKPTVRMFKNMTRSMRESGLISDDLTSSYFLECLLYNLPDTLFQKDCGATFLSIMGWLADKAENNFHGFMCQNGVLALFGDDPEQWNVENAITYILALWKFYDEWGK